MTKIGENYHATFKNATSHGGVCGIFVSKNTTQNSIFFENPTPRGGILKYHESDPTRGEISNWNFRKVILRPVDGFLL